jgi:hypothetical protein
MINCTKCEKEKNECEFRVRTNLKRGYHSWCKECEKEANKTRYTPKPKKEPKIVNEDEVKLKAKIRMLKFRYGLTYEDYVKMYDDQDGKCKICEREYSLGGTNGLYVDHCHTTNIVRGLLCPICNTAIGWFKEDKKIFENAIKYLNS